MSSMRVGARASVGDAARTVFVASALVASAAAALTPAAAQALHGAGRTMFAIGLAVLNVSLVCAAASLAPGRTLESLLGRRRWLLGAWVALVLGVALDALAPLVSAFR